MLTKYFNFAADSINSLMESIGVTIHVPGLEVLLPVGISFYIFQALGYSIDVYRGEIKPERSFLTYALFVSFFPQLVAGPIERSKNLLKQFKEDRAFNGDWAISGFKLMLWGYFMKLCLADRCGLYVDPVFNNLANHEGMSTLLAAFLFTFQIYGDFAGYTFIAIGCGRIMGFHLNENFRRPYLAATITEFWHRWHISLSTWLRDYVYFPLGGSRGSKLKSYRNIMLTFLVSGIWHGANWTFVLWGMLHGLIQCVERYLGWNKAKWTGIRRIVQIGITFIIASIAWVLFRANTLGEAFTALRLMCSRSDISLVRNKSTLLYIAIILFVIAIKELIEERGLHNQDMPKVVTDANLWTSWIWCTFLLIMIGLFGVFEGGRFIYFQF